MHTLRAVHDWLSAEHTRMVPPELELRVVRAVRGNLRAPQFSRRSRQYLFPGVIPAGITLSLRMLSRASGSLVALSGTREIACGAT